MTTVALCLNTTSKDVMIMESLSVAKEFFLKQGFIIIPSNDGFSVSSGLWRVVEITPTNLSQVKEYLELKNKMALLSREIKDTETRITLMKNQFGFEF